MIPRLLPAVALLASLSLALSACSDSKEPEATETSTTPNDASQYPPAVDAAKVGSYPAMSESGRGYFYDEVLEYRVWFHAANGGDDDYRAFATYAEAMAFFKTQPRAEPPLVLVRQREWIEEPAPDRFERREGERITEWRTEWLFLNTKRAEDSIERFLKAKAGKT